MKGIFAALKEDYAEKNNGLVPLEILKESDRMQEKEWGDEYCTRVDGSLQKKEIPEKQKTKYVFVPGKIAKSILISCGVRLAPFDIAELREIMSYDEMELDKIMKGEKKALFLIMYDTDTTFNFVIAMLQSQLFHLLCDKAGDEYGERLPVHGEPVMTAEYRPVEYGKDYDVVDNPDKFQLYIDGKEIK